jgi:hypothetical protein
MKLKDLQGSGTGLIPRTISAYAWRNHKKKKKNLTEQITFGRDLNMEQNYLPLDRE